MQVGTSCTSTVSRGTDYTFTWLRRVESSSSLFAVRAGVLWLGKPSRDLTPESLRGSESLRILPSVLPVTSLHETSCGFHRFEPVKWNGVATAPGNVTYPTRNFARSCLRDRAEMHYLTWAKQRVPFTLLLHVAMQMGLYLHRRSASSSSAFGV